MFRISFLKKLFLILIVLCVYILLVYWQFFVKNLFDVKFKNYSKTNIITNIKNKIKQKTEIYFSKILFIKLFYFLKYLIDLHMFRLWLRQNLFKISTKGYKNLF
jgi:hypothetical protein